MDSTSIVCLILIRHMIVYPKEYAQSCFSLNTRGDYSNHRASFQSINSTNEYHFQLVSTLALDTSSKDPLILAPLNPPTLVTWIFCLQSLYNWNIKSYAIKQVRNILQLGKNKVWDQYRSNSGRWDHQSRLLRHSTLSSFQYWQSVCHKGLWDFKPYH